MRRFIRDKAVEILGTVREGAEYGLFDDCEAALSAIRNILAENLSREAFSRYEGKFELENIEHLEHLLANEPEVQREIVFFPYKAAMWDSLESVWIAAKEDKDCYVSVVPIPYYEIENGTPIMRYEGGLYPNYVPIVDWRKYDLETTRPDVAYIHNAYDERNYVTRVEPRFFTGNLKKYVDLLVYVPYYASDTRPGQGIALTAAYCDADILVASSESDKEAYLEVGASLDIAVLGSPKIDRIINMEKEKPPLPPEWENLRGKKVFFLNTSIQSMLIKTHFYFEKLRRLFYSLKERDDVALLWRPHPLTRATIDSMRPAFREQFEELERLIRSSRFGVLDETRDMGTAIALSDAYIGDGVSSLVYLYALTGKPMYILNYKMPNEPSAELKEELLESDMIYWGFQNEGDEGWGVCTSVNALCRIDLETARARFEASFPGEKNIGWLYSMPVKLGNRLLFSPALARAWLFYDIETRKWEKRDIPAEAVPKLDRHIAFGWGEKRGGAVIFFPGTSGIIARYDINRDEFTYHTEMARRFERRIINLDLDVVSGYCKNGEYIYMSSAQCNIITELNTDTMKFRFYEVGGEQDRYYQIAFAGNRFWLAKTQEPGRYPWTESLFAWKPGDRYVTEYPNLPVCQGSAVPPERGFSFLTEAAGWVYAFPYQADGIVRLDPKTGIAERFELNPSFDYFERKSPYYTWADETALAGLTFPRRDKITAFIPYDCSIMEIDLRTGECGERKKWRIEGIGHLKKSVGRLLPTPWQEQAFLTPGDFIERVLSGEIAGFDDEQARYYRSINVNSDGSCGRRIHEYVKSKLNGRRGTGK